LANFTDKIISEVSSKKDNIVFILWGAYAQSKINLIDSNKHFILQSVHPSPLSASRGFLGVNTFQKQTSI
jgi:uracil-DNA glycosylase